MHLFSRHPLRTAILNKDPMCLFDLFLFSDFILETRFLLLSLMIRQFFLQFFDFCI